MTELHPNHLHAMLCDAAYVADPLALFSQLTQPNDNSLLLESAEIDTKAGTQSLLLVDSCVRLTCRGQTVDAEALNPNGLAVLDRLQSGLPSSVEQLRNSDERLTLNFPAIDTEQDEDSRLKALSVLDSLRTLLTQLHCEQGQEAIFLGGIFAYDLIANYENLPAVAEARNDCPDFCFYVAETLIHIDHRLQRSQLRAVAFGGDHFATEYQRLQSRLATLAERCNHFVKPELPAALPLEGIIQTNRDDKAYCADVERLKGHIRKGDIFQVVPSRCFSLPCPQPLLAYRQLKKTNPSPYMFYMNDREFTLFGASPESAVKFETSTRQVEMYPIAGTRRRGLNADGSINLDLDGRIELDLRQDSKETAEHLMLVDLARNDIARISEPGTVHVTKLRQVEYFSHVMHMVSEVVGKLKKGYTPMDVLRATFPAGTVSGAPKLRAMEIINELEPVKRNSYSGTVGYMDFCGNMDMCITLRTMRIENDDTAVIQSGAGIVADSVPEKEYQEILQKSKALFEVVEEVENDVVAFR